VRLAEVDAPETGQAFGNRSRQALAALCFRRSAQLRPVSIDRYGRTVAHVDCGGTDAGTAQVSAGLAWVFVRYAPAGSDLYRIEREARVARVGLWSDPNAVAPWIWREMKRSPRATGMPGTSDGQRTTQGGSRAYSVDPRPKPTLASATEGYTSGMPSANRSASAAMMPSERGCSAGPPHFSWNPRDPPRRIVVS
jgi:hypothetical protein